MLCRFRGERRDCSHRQVRKKLAVNYEAPADHLAALRLETRDREAAHQWLSDVYVPHAVRRLGRPDGFWFRAASAPTHTFAVDRLRYTTAAEIATDVGDGILVCPVVLRGAFAIDDRREELRLRPGGVALYAFERPRDMSWPEFDMLILRMPLRAVVPLAEQAGVAAADLRFEGAGPVSASMAAYWRRAVVHAHRELGGPESALRQPLLAAHMTQLLAASLLATFPNTTMWRDQLRGAGAVAPAVIRRATAFIDANAARPVTVVDIARAAGVSARALQYAFVRHLEMTPSGYVRRVRLERAHRELQAADPTQGATVAAIAARWGFPKAGHFAALYRRAYGAPPSHTLRT